MGAIRAELNECHDPREADEGREGRGAASQGQWPKTRIFLGLLVAAEDKEKEARITTKVTTKVFSYQIDEGGSNQDSTVVTS